jgi:hypothetical protein
MPAPTVGKPPPPQYPPEYYSARRLRRAGIGLVIPGSILLGLGGLVMLVNLAPDTYEPGALRAGIGIAVLGLGLMIPGIALAVTGRKRAEAAMRQAAWLPLPSLAYNPELKSAHLALMWRF